MSCIKAKLWLGAVALVATACTEQAPTMIASDVDALMDLDLHVPAVSDLDLITMVAEKSAPPPSPLQSDNPEDEDSFGFLDEVGGIFDARTRVGVDVGYAYALGSHQYVGNKGRIVTQADVAFEGAHLGSQKAETEQYGIFLFDGGRVKHIWANAKVFTDHTCGLSVNGTSQHYAWWEFYQARSAPTWGLVSQTSAATPAYQSTCRHETGGYQYGGEPSGDGGVCYYWITYDLDTLEILSADLLFCTSSSGDIW